jgi:hypothetical protein
MTAADQTEIDSIVTALDRQMLMDRNRARLSGADDWTNRLRREAVQVMTSSTGVPEEIVEADLELYLAESPLSVEQALENVVFRQRLLAVYPEAAQVGGGAP